MWSVAVGEDDKNQVEPQHNLLKATRIEFDKFNLKVWLLFYLILISFFKCNCNSSTYYRRAGCSVKLDTWWLSPIQICLGQHLHSRKSRHRLCLPDNATGMRNTTQKNSQRPQINFVGPGASLYHPTIQTGMTWKYILWKNKHLWNM